MQAEVLIVGQGICGTFLSWYLERAGLSSIMIDEPRTDSASRTAAGVINPVTGRRLVKTWMIDELLAFARPAYDQIGTELGGTFLFPKNIIDLFATPQMRLAFLKRQQEEPQMLLLPAEEQRWQDWFRYDFGFGEVQPGYLVDIGSLLAAYRSKLVAAGRLLEERFSLDSLLLQDQGAVYQDIRCSWVIFCDGIASCSNPWFKNLPFAPNKGEALILQAEGIPTSHIFKKGMQLVPWKDSLFWVGASYAWQFEDDRPTTYFRNKTEAMLSQWLRVPYKVVDHLASVRPATLERRPFVGFHPTKKNLGLLNGMGTKGCSLAPFYAAQLVNHMTGGSPLEPEADIDRFRNLLSRII
jgi:glycine/D-amino acid oxidase-like deaminating enzyme